MRRVRRMRYVATVRHMAAWHHIDMALVKLKAGSPPRRDAHACPEDLLQLAQVMRSKQQQPQLRRPEVSRPSHERRLTNITSTRHVMNPIAPSSSTRRRNGQATAVSGPGLPLSTAGGRVLHALPLVAGTWRTGGGLECRGSSAVTVQNSPGKVHHVALRCLLRRQGHGTGRHWNCRAWRACYACQANGCPPGPTGARPDRSICSHMRRLLTTVHLAMSSTPGPSRPERPEARRHGAGGLSIRYRARSSLASA